MYRAILYALRYLFYLNPLD